MNSIVYQQVNPIIEQRIIKSFGDWTKDYLHQGEGCYTLIALDDDEPIGLISTYPLQYTEPIEQYRDAYIDVLEVAENYRRRGIASKLIRDTENWSREYGYKQIRSWSSENKTEAIHMWYSLDYCVCPAWMRGYSTKKGEENKPIDGFYVAKMLNPLEKFPDIVAEIRKEVAEILPHSYLNKITLIRAKAGIYVYRVMLDNRSAVVKYFEKEVDKKEINNYRMLAENHIDTIEVIAYGSSCIILDDIDANCDWRLGCEDDMNDLDVAVALARWYFNFHEKGLLYPFLSDLYCEFDDITIGKLKLLKEKLPEAAETFDYITHKFNTLHEKIKQTEQTYNYNDFYWTNLIVRRDKSEVIVFDYNLLGEGYRYNDLRNVAGNLSTNCSKCFISEYNMLFSEKYGRNRVVDETREKEISDVTSPLVALIAAFDRKSFPSWANGEKQQAIDGTLLSAAKRLLE